MGKIVVFDSGFGGLTVLKELVSLMPDEEYIYYGDSANAPYGEKSHDELLKLGSDICSRLSSEYDVKCFVIACNTTTSEVWDELTDRFGDHCFVGIEPALLWAAEENPGSRILVLATTATINGKRLRGRYEALKDKAQIALLPAPGIVPFVEDKDADPEVFAEYMDELLEPYKDASDCVVLGCTHFPFVKNEIKTALGHEIKFYDAAVRVAETVKRLISGEINHDDREGDRSFGMPFSSGKIRKQAAAETAAQASDAGIIFLNSDPVKAEQEKTLFELYRKQNMRKINT